MYLYKHIRLDKNEVFYIGIGGRGKETPLSYKRAYKKHNRSKYWHNIVNKTDYIVEIVFDNLTIEQAILKEIEFIKLYGREDLGLGTLCNLTDGGNLPPILIGDKNPMKLEINKNKLSKIMTGKLVTEKTKKKQSEIAILNGNKPPSRKGINRTSENINKMVETRLKNGLGRKKIYQYDLCGNFIKEWDYSGNIKIEGIKIRKESITNVCNKNRNSVYGFYWTYDKNK